MSDPTNSAVTQDVPVGPITIVSTVLSGPAQAPFPQVPHIPGYEIVRPLDRGGMGVVYEARQLAANRVVALKMILAGAESPEQLARFRTEAEAVARLHHPGIVQIHEVGEHRGQPYFSLEFCSGGSLKERLRTRPLEPRAAALLLVAVAQATQAAHDAGIIHRDLTPGNVLFDAQDRPRLADFGLAKKLDDVGRTQSGAIMGTPCYMAPEQALGNSKQVGPAADVWALGAILYECLTGRPPFRADTSLETILLVISQEPAPPCQLRVDLPRDLETICLKCLEKSAERRYRSAAEFGEDLARWLRNEPIQARQVHTLERMGLWARRHPAHTLALAASTLAVLFAVFGGSSAWLWRDAEEARAQAVQARVKMEEAHEREREAQERLMRAGSLHQVELAYRDWQINALPRARHLLQRCPEPWRDWEWRYVHHLCQRHQMELGNSSAPVRVVAYSPDGAQIVTAGDDKTMKLWAASGEFERVWTGFTHSITCLTYSRDGKRLVVGCADGQVTTWDVQSGRKLLAFAAHSHPITSVSVSEDDGWVASAAGGSMNKGDIKIHDARTGLLVRSLLKLTQGVLRTEVVAFAPEGKQLAFGVADHVIKIWDLEFNREVQSLTGHTEALTGLAFSPNERWLVSASRDRTVRLWSREQPEGHTIWRGHSGAVTCVAFSSDSQTVVSGDEDRLLLVWSLTPGSPPQRIKGHEHSLTSVALLPHGEMLVSAGGTLGQPGEVRLWRLDAGQEAISIQAHSRPIRCLTFTTDGDWLLTGSDDTTVRVWDTKSGRQVEVPPGHRGRITSLAVSRDGQWLVTGSIDQTVRVWEAATEVAIATLHGHQQEVVAVALSPNARWLASAGLDGTVRLWDRVSKRVVHCLTGHRGAVRALAFLDDQRLVSGGDDHAILLWDAATGRKLGQAHGHESGITSLCAGPQADQFTSASVDNTLRIWDSLTCCELRTLTGHQNSVTAVICTPDGKHIVSASEDSSVRVWTAAGSFVRSMPLTSPGTSLAVSPDSQRLAVTGASDRIVVGDISTGRMVVALNIPSGVEGAVAFSADNQRLIWGGTDGRCRRWDTKNWRAEQFVLTAPGAITQIQVKNNGESPARIEVHSTDGTARTWDARSGRLLAQETSTSLETSAFDRHGRRLVLSPVDRSVSVRETASGHEIFSLRGHRYEVTTATISPDGKRIVTGAADGTLKLWDTATGLESFTLMGLEKPITAVVFSSDGKRLAAATSEGEVRIWHAPSYALPPRSSAVEK